METDKLKKLVDLYGPLMDIVGPSGKRYIIREQNGADDDLLSSNTLSKDAHNINIFVCSIVVWTDAFGGGKIDSDNIKGLLVKDKYFILFTSRIYSIGPIIKFSYDWGKDNGGLVDYSEDLSDLLWDYSDLENNPVPIDGDDNYNRFRMTAYESSFDPYKVLNFTTSSGKVCKIRMTDVEAETILIKKGNDITRNDDLMARGLEIMIDGAFTKVKNFKFFSKKDMIEVHHYVSQLEKPFFGFSEIENPKTNEVTIYPLIIDPAFFFPLAI